MLRRTIRHATDPCADRLPLPEADPALARATGHELLDKDLIGVVEFRGQSLEEEGAGELGDGGEELEPL